MRTEEEMVAYALEAEPELLPYLPELLADLEELGSDAELITETIGKLGLPADAKVIDLGCGKGAVAVEIATELGLNVLGIDLFEPFVTHGQNLATEEGVADRCQFLQGDIAKLAGTLDPVDLVVFAALGDVIGRLDETVAIIRRYVKPGGYLVISDAFVQDDGSADFPGFEQYAKHKETLARLTSQGDKLVSEVLPELDEEQEDDEGAMIAGRATMLALKHPDMGDAFMEFAAMQSSENHFIEDNLVDAIWVLQRG